MENEFITDYFAKHITAEEETRLEKRVLNEMERIDTTMVLKERIKEYCTLHKLRFVRYTKGGFDAYSLQNIRAGVIKNKRMHFKTIAKKKVTCNYICYTDGDIVYNGII